MSQNESKTRLCKVPGCPCYFISRKFSTAKAVLDQNYQNPDDWILSILYNCHEPNRRKRSQDCERLTRITNTMATFNVSGKDVEVMVYRVDDGDYEAITGGDKPISGSSIETTFLAWVKSKKLKIKSTNIIY